MATRDYNIIDVIDEVAELISTVLNNRQVDKYFSSVVLLYSFIENLLIWLVYVKVLWDKAGRGLSDKEVATIKQFCNQLTFHNALNLAFAVRLLDWELFQRLDEVRQERNSIVHQLWLYEHREKLHILRKKLEKLARVGNKLVGLFNKLVRQTGADRTYPIFVIRARKGILV